MRLNALKVRADNDRMSLRLVTPREPAECPTMTGLLAGLSFALDLADGQRFGHTLRSTLIGLGLAEVMGLGTGERRELFHALLLKDLGGPGATGALHRLFGGDDRRAKHDLRRMDWRRFGDVMRTCAAHDDDPRWLTRTTRAVTRTCHAPRLANEALEARAAHAVARVGELGLGEPVARTIAAIGEHWDGGGGPHGVRGSAIPLAARIAALAQSAEVCLALGGPAGALAMARERRGRWFEPALVVALGTLEREMEAWSMLGEHELIGEVIAGEPGAATLLLSDAMLERVARAFARVVDAKSSWTAGHSEHVAEMAGRVACGLGFGTGEVGAVRRAALLHDLGKLALPVSILDQQGPLSPEQWESVRRQPYYTHRILSRVRGVGPLADDASSHHERIDGRGYFRGLSGDRIPLTGRIIAVADSFQALTSDRPFRGALPEETALRLLARDRGIGIDPDCHAALVDTLEYTGIEPLERAA